MQQIRSRVEVVLLWAQLILVLGDAVSIAQGLVSMEAHGHAWVTLLPLVCVLPAAAAFRETRAAAIGVTAGAVATLAGLAWAAGGWGALLSGLCDRILTWGRRQVGPGPRHPKPDVSLLNHSRGALVGARSSNLARPALQYFIRRRSP